MAGVEIVGLILGVMGVGGTFQSLTKSARNLTKASDSFKYFIDDTSSRVHRYEKRYLDLCFSLLEPMGLEELEARQMFGTYGAQHPNWWNALFIKKMERFLGSAQFEISDTMKGVQRELERLQRKGAKIWQLASKDQPTSHLEPDRKLQLSTSEKFKLSDKLKKSTEESLLKLRDRLAEFKEVIENFLRLKQKGLFQERQKALRDLEQHTRKQIDDDQWEIVEKGIQYSQRSSKYLFQTLNRLFICQCHDLKLKLDFDLFGSPTRATTSRPCLGFLVTLVQGFGDENLGIVLPPGDPQSGRDVERHHALEIRCHSIKTSNLVQSASPDISMQQMTHITGWNQSLSQNVLPVIDSHFPPCSSSPKAKAFAFARKIPAKLHIQRPEAPLVPAAPDLALNQSLYGPSLSQEDLVDHSASDSEEIKLGSSSVINNLCTIFSEIQIFRNARQSYLGFLNEGDRFQYRLVDKGDILHRTSDGNPMSSLRDILTDSDEFLTVDRLNIAYHMAASLLRLHLPSWIARGWTSTDVIIMHGPSSTMDEEDWTPVSRCFERRAQGTPNATEPVINHPNISTLQVSHIAKLGIVLLEVGQATILPDGLPPDQVLEEAQKLLKVSKIRRLVGPKYCEVVRVCLDWRGSTGMPDDLHDVEVQRRFYNEVVHKLKVCLDKF